VVLEPGSKGQNLRLLPRNPTFAMDQRAEDLLDLAARIGCAGVAAQETAGRDERLGSGGLEHDKKSQTAESAGADRKGLRPTIACDQRGAGAMRSQNNSHSLPPRGLSRRLREPIGSGFVSVRQQRALMMSQLETRAAILKRWNTMSTRILAGLIVGLAAGAMFASQPNAILDRVLTVTTPIGQLWLDALTMTVVPLVFSLLVTGVGSATSSAAAGGVATRAMVWFVILLVGACLISAAAQACAVLQPARRSSPKAGLGWRVLSPQTPSRPRPK
jgi:hypothetical protein